MTFPLQPFPTGGDQAAATAESLAYYERMIQLVDARIAAAQRKTEDFGTVQERDPVGPGATVVFDGDAGAQPVKVPGHVHCFAGDRVVLNLVKGTWVVMGTFNRRQLSEASNRQLGPGAGGTTTSASFVDQPVGIAWPFLKRYDLTATVLRLNSPCYVPTASATTVQTAIRVSGAPGTSSAVTFTPIDVNIGFHHFSTAQVNQHIPVIGATRTTGIPAGSYILTPRWRRVSGAATLSQDDKDLVIIEADEIFRESEV